MSEPADSDPERLLAEALRAQARAAPSPPRPPDAATARAEQQRPATGEQADDGLPHGYGLLSGTGASSLERERAALDDLAGPSAGQEDEPVTVEHQLPAKEMEPRPPAPLAARWILLLAVLLGLAAGSVVGLLTLL
ncbi:hypothetical protein [Amycolatopsis palatopharyngis]|uniref:hypothetical protein n=1 Tax=Amycolatopsis palatopharyngis TaxID=187982 RepID=UPI000E273A40|nr:hypothetical protein [Amycolatopsis palatopharyngis]